MEKYGCILGTTCENHCSPSMQNVEDKHQSGVCTKSARQRFRTQEICYLERHLTTWPHETCCPASALKTSSFAPVKINAITTMEDAVEICPDFFKGTKEDGAGPGPHFITMSFIKDKLRIRDQLLKALMNTVTFLTTNLPNALIHCIQKDAKPPPLLSTTGPNFPTTGMQARNYLFI
jgi:hypothetical protein